MDVAERTIPLGVHQAIEYLLGGLAFVWIARVEPQSAPLCAGAGAVLIVLAALSGGRVGLAHLIGPRLHRVLDHVVAVGLAASPWWSGIGWGVGAVWLVEGLAIVLLWLTRSTAYRRKVKEAPTAPTATDPAPSSASSDAVAATARAAGRLAGTVGRKGPRAAGVAVGRLKKRRR